jgi:hypothetical protein
VRIDAGVLKSYLAVKNIAHRLRLLGRERGLPIGALTIGDRNRKGVVMEMKSISSPMYFSEQNSVEAVVSRMGELSDRRLIIIMTSAIQHLHAFIKEVEPSNDEWMVALEFLTRTGQMCNESRQEWILLSDVLGVSMLVDTINNRDDGSWAVSRLRVAKISKRGQHLLGGQRRAAGGLGPGYRHRGKSYRRGIAGRLAGE